LVTLFSLTILYQINQNYTNQLFFKRVYYLLLLILFPIVLVGQGYYNQENFGNSSILLSGNVTGGVADLGLTYYNPARIALVENPVFAINAKAYQFSTIKLENVFGRDDKLGDSNFNEVPSLVAGTFKIEKWENQYFAYAFISKLRSRTNINFINDFEEEDLEGDLEGLDRLTAQLSLENKETDEWIGATWGTKIKDNFSIGVSAFVSIYNYKNNFNLKYSTLDQIQSVDSYSKEFFVRQSSYGMFWKVGLAWKVKKYELGLNIDLPYLEVIKGGRLRLQEYLSGTENDIFKFADFRDIKSNRKEPLGISFGASFPTGKNKIHMKVDWHGKLNEYNRLVIPQVPDVSEGITFKEERRSVVNFGIGAEIFLNEKWNMYGSVSTDFSPFRASSNIFDLIGGDTNDNIDFDANYYHFGMGVDLKMKKVHLIMGLTYATGSDKFEQPIDFPDSNVDFQLNDNPSRITITRWRFIVGLEIPIFGRDLEFK
jgi:hypothetical protein